MKKPQSYVADFSVTNFTAEISSAWLTIVYHVNAEKETGIVRIFGQIAKGFPPEFWNLSGKYHHLYLTLTLNVMLLTEDAL